MLRGRRIPASAKGRIGVLDGVGDTTPATKPIWGMREGKGERCLRHRSSIEEFKKERMASQLNIKGVDIGIWENQSIVLKGGGRSPTADIRRGDKGGGWTRGKTGLLVERQGTFLWGKHAWVRGKGEIGG